MLIIGNPLANSRYDAGKVAQLSSRGKEKPLHVTIVFACAIEMVLEKTG
jgi:hypothetical protein